MEGQYKDFPLAEHARTKPGMDTFKSSKIPPDEPPDSCYKGQDSFLLDPQIKKIRTQEPLSSLVGSKPPRY